VGGGRGPSLKKWLCAERAEDKSVEGGGGQGWERSNTQNNLPNKPATIARAANKLFSVLNLAAISTNLIA
jgi:hypothetical protein